MSAGRVVDDHRDHGPGRIPLTDRQLQVLTLLLNGDSEKQIAPKLGISPHTVHVHVKAIYRSFGISSRGELLSHDLRHIRQSLEDLHRAVTHLDHRLKTLESLRRDRFSGEVIPPVCPMEQAAPARSTPTAAASNPPH